MHWVVVYVVYDKCDGTIRLSPKNVCASGFKVENLQELQEISSILTGNFIQFAFVLSVIKHFESSVNC